MRILYIRILIDILIYLDVYNLINRIALNLRISGPTFIVFVTESGLFPWSMPEFLPFLLIK